MAGQPAYKRKASERPADLKPRPTRIDWCHLYAYDWPNIDFEICCGRGTYVRALIRDLGRQLRTGGCLTSLVRRQVGPFAEADAWSFDALDRAPDSTEYLTRFDRAVELLAPQRVVIPLRPIEQPSATVEGPT